MNFRCILFVPIFAMAGFGQAVITLPSGNVSLGIGAFGELGNCAGADCTSDLVAMGTPGLPANANVTAPFIGDTGDLAGQPYGIYLASQNADSVTPGCFCEGWGASYNGSVQGNSSNSNGGNTGILGVSFTSTANSATSVTSIGNLNITQAFAPAPGAGGTWLFQDTVTIQNTGGATDTNVQYARSTDWDINPTEFHEIETLGGWGATALTFSVNNGFCNDDPLTLASSCNAIATATNPGATGLTDANFTQDGTADQGSSFLFNLGSLTAGQSISFNIFYGAADNNADAVSALGAVGAQVYVLGYSSDATTGTANLSSGTWLFAFSGVGGTPISSTTPEPATLLLAGSTLLGLAFVRRKSFRR